MPSSTGTNSAEVSRSVQTAIIALGVAAPFATFAIAVSGLDQALKVVILVALSVFYASVCIWALSKLQAFESGNSAVNKTSGRNTGLEQKLIALEDAREFFGTSLKPTDVFKLVAKRVDDIVPFATCVFLVKDPDNELLLGRHSYGAAAKNFENLTISADSTLAGLSFYSGEIEFSQDLNSDLEAYPFGLLDGYKSSATLPLKIDEDIFGVLQLFFTADDSLDDDALNRLREIADRISPLFVSSMAFERSLSSALTDPVTKLPNERAFQMVLENQLAESLRFREDRPLTVLAVDIRNFEEINNQHGHAVGDRALSFAAEKISSQLRKMDFLARSMNDEFLIVLPKASERIAIEITGRIQAALSTVPLEISDDEHLKLLLNFGWATFWRDGETAHQLISGALSRKQQAKSEEQESSVFLPKEYVH